MNLDRECVRDFLLTLESLRHDQNLSSSKYRTFPLLKHYELETVQYTARKLDEAGFINVKYTATLGAMDDPFQASSLTWHGHQFLDNIRDDGVWKETKSVASKVASVSVGILSDVAANIMKKTLGLE